jgi:hypothetical protein
VTLTDLLALACENGRICPRPARWTSLYDRLPAKRHDGYGAIPPEPLVLAAWDAADDVLRRERFREHLEWAAAHRAIGLVHAFLAALPEDAWHHEGDAA